MTQTSILDTAGSFSQVRDPIIATSDWRTGARLTGDLNGIARDRRRWLLSWRPCSAYQRRALREHFGDNHYKAFDLNPPGSASPVRVIYGSAPVVRHVSATAADASVELIEVHEES